MAFVNTKVKDNSDSLSTAVLAGSTESNLMCIIAKGTVVTGKLTVSENIRIDGKVVGDIFCSKKLVMDVEGVVEGNVYAGESTIKGTVVGTVNIENTLHLLETSYIKGDIKAKKLHVEEGARYDGKCLIG